MASFKSAFNIMGSFVLFGGGMAATGVALLVSIVFLVGLVDWTGGQGVPLRALPGASEVPSGD